MGEMRIETDKLLGAAREFQQAGKQLREILEGLNETVEGLERNWGGVTKEDFYRQYSDLRKYVEEFASISDAIAKEMRGLAEEVDRIENEDEG